MNCLDATYLRDLEEQNVLNPGSDVDIYCLLICFLHLVQQDLDLFKESWNRHKIRTAGNMSPYQLYITGLHNLSSYGQQCGHDFTELKQVLCPCSDFKTLDFCLTFVVFQTAKTKCGPSSSSSSVCRAWRHWTGYK
jgi:hypothetical protein